LAQEENRQAKKGFFWENKEVSKGEASALSAGRPSAFCRPTTFGGLRTSDLQAQGIAMLIRWLWQEWTDPSKPWQCLPLPIDAKVMQLFNSSINFHLWQRRED
jgi:hypothetical protein